MARGVFVRGFMSGGFCPGFFCPDTLEKVPTKFHVLSISLKDAEALCNIFCESCWNENKCALNVLATTKVFIYL